tara:strand:- start:1498 stop:5589 length:4092 start_codon:yes stop_codon:yes gene_type:complete
MSKNDILEFQIYDFREENVFPKNDNSDSENENSLPKYVIHTFGKTIKGESVYCKITDYTPYFFIELPEDWDKKKAKKNIKHLKDYLTSKYNNKVFPRKYKDGLVDIQLVEKLKPQGFTNGKKFLFALLVFNNEISRKKFANIFSPSVRLRCPECGKNRIDGLKSTNYNSKCKLTKLQCQNCDHVWEKKIYKHCLTIHKISMKSIHYPIYESNFPAFLRCFHIRNIKGCGWVNVSSKNITLPLGVETFKEYEEILDASNQDSMELEDEKESLCRYEFSVKWNKLDPIEKEGNAPLIIASFDIECNSIDGQFPQAKRGGDKVIQIGTTYTYIGESVPFRQHIVCLKDTNNVEGAIVESYQNEKDLMRGWLEEIQRSDCDIMTGWNIFYFDEKYIFDRCEDILGFDNINYLSKLKDHHCNFKEMKLASSAMGENLLRFWETPGRVHVDLMKDVQNNFNLSSYKLDNVSAEFIRGSINEIKPLKNNKYLLKCSSINDINVDDFIHIELLKSFVSDNVGRKYRVDKIDKNTKTLTIKTDFDIITELERLGDGKIFWSQAKDDVSPKDIFRLQKGSADDRAVVAKYCIKDCRLVNLLINKLEVITRCIEMANVCFIPLYFLFTRGQGIKLFSLCSKFYRDFGYIFPVLRKPIVNPGTYEGAIVFDPIASATYETICTKDYASLYPSSILHKNMSHETKIIDEKYDNLPGVEYYNAKFVDNDGSIQYRRFAKVDKKYGVIPTILDTLLKERKAVKKQMKVEKDPFKKSILDGKQLALKITANSLYGQLGAGTSQVRDRDIAACTTSTGREMLIFAKKYDEEFLPYIINGLKYARLNKDNLTFEKIINQELKTFSNELVIDINRYLDEYDKVISLPIIKYGDTDSVFTSFRYRDDVTIIEDKPSIKLLKKIIKFGGKIMEQFLFDENLEIWKKNFKKYYSSSKIKKLVLPEGPDVPSHPDHWKIILPLETRILQFMKEYVELMWFPWLWTLQDLFLKEYNDLSFLKKKQYLEVLEVKIFKKGNSLLEIMKIIPEELSEGKKDIIVTMIKKFIEDNLSQEWIQPYWVYNKEKEQFDNYIKFYQGGYKITEKKCLDLSIDLGILSGELVKSRLPSPHDLEYEKCFWPFIILTKKRYVGNKYEFDKNKYKMNYMGIVLKRRDNAPIVKEVCEGIITRLLNDKSPSKAKKFTKKCMKDMFTGKYDIKYFLTSKTVKLKESYKDWTRISHIVLADRISKRDPGNKPQSGDRIEYAAVCIENETKNTLQGERIETPKFIKEQNLEIDYLFYMTNQIRNPATQFLQLVIKSPEKMFDRFKVKAQNKKRGQIDILNFVTRTKSKKSAESDELSSVTPTDVTKLFSKRLKEREKNINLDI